MHLDEQLVANRRTIEVMHRLSNSEQPSQPEPFPRRQRNRRVCSTYELTPAKYAWVQSSLLGDTWDTQHLDKLLKATTSQNSFLGASRQPRKSQQTQHKNKNACKYGYSNVFPLIREERNQTIDLPTAACDLRECIPHVDYVENGELIAPRQRLERLREFKQQLNDYHESHQSILKQKRLSQLLKCGYRHGVSGFENPETSHASFSEKLSIEVVLVAMQPTLHLQRRIRAQQDYSTHKKSTVLTGEQSGSYELSPGMKHRRHVAASRDPPPISRRQNVRMFAPVSRPYNIVTLLQQS